MSEIRVEFCKYEEFKDRPCQEFTCNTCFLQEEHEKSGEIINK